MSNSNYAKFAKFGANINLGIREPYNVSNPLTYCLFDNLSTQFLHGSTAADYYPGCYQCQNYMATRCAGIYKESEAWDGYCKVYYNQNNDRLWPNPNTAAINSTAAKLGGCCGDAQCSVSRGRLTFSQQLLRNTAERRFLRYPRNYMNLEAFDPNVANRFIGSCTIK